MHVVSAALSFLFICQQSCIKCYFGRIRLLSCCENNDICLRGYFNYIFCPRQKKREITTCKKDWTFPPIIFIFTQWSFFPIQQAPRNEHKSAKRTCSPYKNWDTRFLFLFFGFQMDGLLQREQDLTHLKKMIGLGSQELLYPQWEMMKIIVTNRIRNTRF